ncbi:MAG: universal stress protein [Bacteroidetes bacterium]|nr:universal stress protein [Bacteroidota bacterium]
MELAEEITAYVDNEVNDLREDLPIKILPVLRRGMDYEEIVNYAKEVDAELIVIATHGRTGLLHNLLGSVAEKVIRYAKCPF